MIFLPFQAITVVRLHSADRNASECAAQRSAFSRISGRSPDYEIGEIVRQQFIGPSAMQGYSPGQEASSCPSSESLVLAERMNLNELDASPPYQKKADGGASGDRKPSTYSAYHVHVCTRLRATESSERAALKHYLLHT